MDDDPVTEPADPIGESISPGERALQILGAGKARLSGTLTVPPVGEARLGTSPAVLIVPSAGPGTRDGLVGAAGTSDGLARDLAASLRGAGLASYRYDRRGTGESKLDNETRLSFEDLVADARAGLDLLAQRKETSGRDLSIIGYDQGGLVALRLAATDSRVKRLVLISTPGRSVVDVQAAELAAQYGPESAAALRATVTELLSTGRLPALEAMRAELRPLLPPPEATFLTQLYALDPAAEAAKVEARALIVVGQDAGPYDAIRLKAALRRAELVAATGASPNLLISGPAPADDPANPLNSTHGAGPAGVPPTRDAATIDHIAVFLAGRPRN